MNQERTVSPTVFSAYMISALVTMSTVAILRFVVAPHAQAAAAWSAESADGTEVESPGAVNVLEQIQLGYVGEYGPPLRLPSVEVAETATPYLVVRDEATEQWSQLLPSLQLVAYRSSSVPNLDDLGQMRVGITNELETVQLSSNKQAQVESTQGVLLATVPKGEVITITPSTNTYTVSTSQGVFSMGGVRFIPRTGGVVTVENYEDRPGWNTDLNDNVFRGRVLVARGTDNTTWVVNVLRLGPYVRGIAEASNSSPVEYQKALSVAARTYAVYNMLHPTKHEGEPYILDNTSGDQVYRGYNLEQRAEIWAASARSTSKQVLMYDDEVIVAPYFSQSDGRTRSWSEVWGGEYPWAVSVSDPGCEGLELQGHGVGMSGKGGVYFAEEGQMYEEILTYYYTGVRLETLESVTQAG
ncbi:MAG: SpoIID/LytB domain-containing protein [Patescibacteria group bacterium]